MKTNAEIRREARAILKAGWFWRISTVVFALYALLGIVAGVMEAMARSCGVQSWSAFLQSKLGAAQGGLDYVLPSASVGWSMTGMSVFTQLAMWLFGGILLFGLASVLLKAVRDERHRWFAESFGGFQYPFGVLSLVILINLLVFLWSLLLIVPGIIAMYRYRQAWYLKSEHPDWGAWRCLAESGKMMKGRKWQACWLDCSFIVWILVLSLFMGGAAIIASVSAVLGSIALLFAFWGFIYLVVYVLAARAVFYREVKASVA